MILEDFHEITRVFLVAGTNQCPPITYCAPWPRPWSTTGAPAFSEILEAITEKNRKRFSNQTWGIHPDRLGHRGLEAAVVNFINPGEKVIVASIGNFGERFEKLPNSTTLMWNSSISAGATPLTLRFWKNVLAKDVNHEIKAILCQHNETSTAVVNPIKAVSKQRKKATLPFWLWIRWAALAPQNSIWMDGMWTLPLPAPKEPLWLRRDWHSLPPMNEPWKKRKPALTTNSISTCWKPANGWKRTNTFYSRNLRILCRGRGPALFRQSALTLWFGIITVTETWYVPA